MTKFILHDSPDTLLTLGTKALNEWLSQEIGAEHIPPLSGEDLANEIFEAIQALPEGLAIFDTQARMIFCNESYARLCADQMPPHEGVFDHQSPPTAAGGSHWLRHISHALPRGARLALGVDVSDLHQKITQAEAATRAKSAFLANISHEIRTPMTGVIGMAQLLCETPLGADQRLYVETIRSSAEALLVIINDLLDYSKLEANRMVLRAEPVDLERLIHEVMLLLHPRAQAKQVELLIDYDVFLPTGFICDPGRLRQIMTNLIGNAVKFTEKGHIMTRIVGHRSGASGDYQLHITVEDSGIGIPADQLDHIFGEFNQVETAQTQQRKGTGLGLSISKGLIEQMGGMVWVDSILGEGSVFGFKVGLEAIDQANTPPSAIALRRILVVNARYLNRLIFEKQLGHYGLDVTLCQSPSEALALFQTGQSFDVALIDHDLPEVSGSELAQRLRDNGFCAPIILLSSNPEQEPPKAVDSILQKPVLRSTLYNKLSDLGRPALQTPAPLTPNLRPMRVMVAEDNQTNRMILQMFLGKLDIDLVFAEDGIQAVDYWKIFAPDLIFMDISMPNLSGSEATSAIRKAEESGERPQESPPHTPILALSAHDRGHSQIGEAFDGHLTKPIVKDDILSALSRYCPAEARFNPPA